MVAASHVKKTKNEPRSEGTQPPNQNSLLNTLNVFILVVMLVYFKWGSRLSSPKGLDKCASIRSKQNRSGCLRLLTSAVQIIEF